MTQISNATINQTYVNLLNSEWQPFSQAVGTVASSHNAALTTRFVENALVYETITGQHPGVNQYLAMLEDAPQQFALLELTAPNYSLFGPIQHAPSLAQVGLATALVGIALSAETISHNVWWL